MVEGQKQILIPAASTVDEVACDLIKIKISGGYDAAARFFIKKGSGSFNRAVLVLHGIQSHGGWFLGLCDYLRTGGHAVLAPDRRGSGLNDLRRGDCDNPGQLIKDVDCCVERLRAETGIEKIDIAAISWSGKLALAYADKYSQKVRSVILVTPGLCAKIDIGLKEKIIVGVDGLVHPRKLHEIPLNEPTLFTENPPKLEFLRSDPLKLTHATASFYITSARLDGRVRKVADRIKSPVYLFLAELDRIIDNSATTELLKKVLKPIDGVAAKIYPGAHHTLDFEPGAECFYEDVERVLR